MKGLPVLSPDEMQRIEKLAYEAGESEERFMEAAGAGIAQIVEHELITPRGGEHIYLLIGKGNNGGDAFVAGEILLQKGFPVTAILAFPIQECSPLSQTMHARFLKAGGTEGPIDEIGEKGVILDGLLGTGFHGEPEGNIATFIQKANQSSLPIFAIDIPSALKIKAQITICLGLPKDLFFQKGVWDLVGTLHIVDFGLPQKFIDEAHLSAYLLSEDKAKKALPPIHRERHKYEAGYVVEVAGSPGMSGAAIMAGFAALKSGAGIVRLFHPKGMEEELSSAPYELIREAWDLKDATRILEEIERAKALLIGPGMGRDETAKAALKTLFSKSSVAAVVDADALYHLNEVVPPPGSILTPHHGEMQRILGVSPTPENCQKYVEDRCVTLVLKGAPTWIFHPHELPLIVPYGDPGMATAGSGDVLTGVIAAFMAAGLDCFQGAALGVYLHALAGTLAAESETSYGVTATDILAHLPDAFKFLTEE